MEHKTLCMTIEGARNLEFLAQTLKMTQAQLVEKLVEIKLLQTAVFGVGVEMAELETQADRLWEAINRRGK